VQQPPVPAQPAPPGGYAYPYQYMAPPPPPLSPGGQRLAEFTDRLLARLIDGAILFGVTLLLFVPIYVIFFITIFNNLPSTVTVNGEQVSAQVNPLEVFLPFIGLFLFAWVLTIAIGYVYEVEMMFRGGQTIGKRAMKIRVIPIDPQQTLTRKAAAKRFLVDYIAGTFLPGMRWLDGLWQLWDKPYRQCLHDKFAATVVIKLNP
jgi:uncharacterized RDD family membrane protein YckC